MHKSHVKLCTTICWFLNGGFSSVTPRWSAIILLVNTDHTVAAIWTGPSTENQEVLQIGWENPSLTKQVNQNVNLIFSFKFSMLKYTLSWPGAWYWCTRLKVTQNLALVSLFNIRSRWYLARGWRLWISSHWKSLCLPIWLKKRGYFKKVV